MKINMGNKHWNKNQNKRHTKDTNVDKIQINEK